VRKYVGDEFAQWVKKNIHPLDIVFRLAEDHGIVVLNGGGFAAPDWSLRVSFANLDDDVYDDIGRAVRAVARGYFETYEATRKAVAIPACRTPRFKRGRSAWTGFCSSSSRACRLTTRQSRRRPSRSP
jgi:hypothetical protein